MRIFRSISLKSDGQRIGSDKGTPSAGPLPPGATRFVAVRGVLPSGSAAPAKRCLPVLLALLVAALIGCGGSDDDSEGGPDPSSMSPVEQKAASVAGPYCKGLGMESVQKTFGGSDSESVAQAYAQATFEPEAQAAAAQACVEGFGG